MKSLLTAPYLILSTTLCSGLEPVTGALFVRVVVVGAGLCCIIKTPDNRYIIYDAGNFEDRGGTAIRAAAKLIPDGSTVELMILSHSDADHLAAVPTFCRRYKFKEVIHSGLTRETGTYTSALSALKKEVETDGCSEVDLGKMPEIQGKRYKMGDLTLTVVCGFHRPPTDWNLSETSEINNAGSIVTRLEYRGRSILFCGDAVGRHIGDPDDVCIATERFMVDNASTVAIDCDVVIAPHHGADNGSSSTWIRAISPEYVIFSAGHKFRHPRNVAALRYTAHGIPNRNMFRTDRGDDEGSDEWRFERKVGAVDVRGDDDVDVLLKSDGTMEINYRVRPRS